MIRRIGIVDELEADVDRAAAAQRSRNLAAFLDQVHAFEPVEGELTLRAFLDYVDSVEALEKEEWEPVQPSESDSVKVMTIHQAKGLEFDHVFVPGVAAGLMPSPSASSRTPPSAATPSTSSCAATRPSCPRSTACSRTSSATCRPRRSSRNAARCTWPSPARARSLHVSASNWYGENVRAKGPSEFFAELADWGTTTGEADVTIEASGPPPGDDEARRAEPDARLPRVARARLAGPGAARRRRRRPSPTAGGAPPSPRVEAGAVQTALVDALDADDRAAFERVAADRRQLAAHLREREAVEGGPSVERAPQAVGASDLITYVQCPKRFYWSRVRPLPRFSGPAARIGTEIHAWIERRARGQGQLLELEDRPDLTDEELAGDPGRVERLREAFLASRFAGVSPLYAERAFLLRLGEFTVGGRIDAIFGEPDGPWEIVDWKTGRKPTADDPTLGLQLDVYGLAAVEIWGKAPSDLTLTYLYLASGDEVAKPMDDPARRARARRGVARRDRRRRVRPDAGPVVHPLRLPLVLRRRPGVARLGRRMILGGSTPCPVAEPLDRVLEASVARRRVVAAFGDAGHEPRVDAGLRGRAHERRAARNHSRSPGWIMHLAVRAEPPVRGVVGDDRRAAERAFQRRAQVVVVALDHRRRRRSSGRCRRAVGGAAASGSSAGGGGPAR